jgi:hypothetical protein
VEKQVQFVETKPSTLISEASIYTLFRQPGTTPPFPVFIQESREFEKLKKFAPPKSKRSTPPPYQ